MKVVSEHTWYIQSSQRNIGDPINNFSVEIPQYFIQLEQNQSLRLKFISFNGLNSFYNVSTQNNTFILGYHYTTGGTPGQNFYTYNATTPVGFYTNFTDISNIITYALNNVVPTDPSIPVLVWDILVEVYPHTNQGVWSWTGIGDLGNQLFVQFPYGRNIHAMMGLPFNFGNPYFIIPQTVQDAGDGTFKYTYTTPFPMMYNYLQNINFRIPNFPGIQNIEYNYKEGLLDWSQLFAKIPVNAQPYENIWFNVQDTEQYVNLAKGTGETMTLGLINFQLTDDFQNLLETDYDWEAVLKIEITTDEQDDWQVNMLKTLEDSLIITHDIEHILMGEPREHDPDEGPKSILAKLEGDMSDINETMKTAFLDDGQSRIWQLTDNIIGAFGAGDNKFGHGSVFKIGSSGIADITNNIRGQLKDISGHVGVGGQVPIGLGAIAAATAGVATATGAVATATGAIATASGAVATASGAIATASGTIAGALSAETITEDVNTALETAKTISENIETAVNTVKTIATTASDVLDSFNKAYKSFDELQKTLEGKIEEESQKITTMDDHMIQTGKDIVKQIDEIVQAIKEKEVDLSKIDLSKLDLDLSKIEVDLSKLNGIELMNLRDISRHLEGIRLTMGEKEIDLAPLIDQLKHQDLYQNSMVDQLNKLNKTLDLTPIANQIKDGNDIWKGVGKIWENIGKNFVSLVKHITGKSAESKMTYDAEISELQRFISESREKDIQPELHSWVSNHRGVKFDPDRSDKDSYNKMISTAITLEQKTHDKPLESWILQHKEK